MRFIDMHCDTLDRMTKKGAIGDLMVNNCSVNIEGMKATDVGAQFFACYINRDEMTGNSIFARWESGYERVLYMIDYLKKEEKAHEEEFSLARNAKEIEENERAGRRSAVLTVEEGGILNGDMNRLEHLYIEGTRLMTLMWNYENCLGHPNSRDEKVMQAGLKPFGIEVVERMNELGMLVDVSHASDGSFWDMLNYSKAPVVASHSNCRALCDHPRNLTDEMIHALAEQGGVSGLNFFGMFLGGKPESGIEEMVAHVMHMVDKGGEDFPAIGSDFDGFFGMEHMDISCTRELERLEAPLRKAGLNSAQIDKIFYQNIMRVLKEVSR